MDRVDPDIAVVLLQRELIAVAVAAQTLEPLADGKNPHLRWVALGDGRQQVEQQLVLFLLIAFGHPCEVDVLRALEDQRQRPFHDGALEEEHPLHIGVFDDRHLRRKGILSRNGPPLRALPGVFEGGVVGGRCDCCRPHSDVDPRLVHHLEHIAEPLVRFTDEPAPAVVVVAEGELRDRRAPVAKFVVDPDAGHIVSGKAALAVRALLRHDEKGDSLHAGRRPFDPGHEKIYDVPG